MWLSTVQSFKILRRVKKNFESNVMKEMKSVEKDMMRKEEMSKKYPPNKKLSKPE